MASAPLPGSSQPLRSQAVKRALMPFLRSTANLSQEPQPVVSVSPENVSKTEQRRKHAAFT